MRSIIRGFDTEVTGFITGWSSNLKPFFLSITVLGDPIVTIGIGIVVATYGFFQANIRLVLAGAAIWITLAVGALLKVIFSRERPLSEYAANLRVDTFSFPSGHTSGATIAYGLLAYLAWQLLPQPWNYIATGVCIVLIVLIGISRVYLGAHFPSDVLAGWLLGCVAVLIVIFAVRPVV